MKTEKINVSDLRHGDTVLINGDARTVGKNSVKHGFCGYCLFGLRFANGVDRVLYKKWINGVFVGFVSQP